MRRVLTAAGLAAALLAGIPAAAAAALSAGHEAAPALTRLAQLPLAFEANRGQTDRAVDFLARGPGYRVFLTSGGAVIDLARRAAAPPASQTGPAAPRPIRLRFIGARPTAAAGLAPLPGKSHYFIGADASKHRTDVPTYAQVRYPAIYPGIDVVYYGRQRQLEYDLVVAPGADPARIRLAFDGADAITLDQDGHLRLKAGDSEVRMHRPDIYQWIGGQRRPVAGRYVRAGQGHYRFQVAAYDPQKPLVIDPVLSYASYLGGAGAEIGAKVAVDAAGNAYLAGDTVSADFPTQGAYDTSASPSGSIFITKINPAGTAILYSTYLGGADGASVTAISGGGIHINAVGTHGGGMAVDHSGNVYLTGQAAGDFPVTRGAYQTRAPTTYDNTFITKLNASGSALVYSTFLAGAGTHGIAVDAGGNAYVVGGATDLFKTTAGVLQPTVGLAGYSAFVAKLNPAGTGMVYATFLGGNQDDGYSFANAIAVDPSGNAYVAGLANTQYFPLQAALQSALKGRADGFVTKLNPTGSALIFSTYLGGTLDDQINAIAVDGSGAVYVAGETYSTDFPSINAFQPNKAGKNLTNSSLGSAFVAKLLPTGDALAYSTFLGGEICDAPCAPPGSYQTRGDAAYGLAVDSLGHAYVTGNARSVAFPLADTLQPPPPASAPPSNQTSLFVTKVGAAGTSLLYSTLQTHDTLDYCWGCAPRESAIAADAAGNVVVVGSATATTTFQATAGALQPAPSGDVDAIVFKLASRSVGMTLTSSANPVAAASPVSLTAKLTDTSLTGNVVFLDGNIEIGSAPLSAGTAVLATTLPAGVRRLTAIYRSSTATAGSPLLHQIVNSGLVCH